MQLSHSKKLDLPEKNFDELKFPKRLISCVWFFTDDLKANEKNYVQLWENIKNKHVSISYTKGKNLSNFLS